LRLAVLGFALVDGLMRSAPAVLFEDYWRRALTMALASRLCFQIRNSQQDVAFSAGLFADLGVLVFAQEARDTYPTIYLNHDHHQDLIAVEQEMFGFDHAAVSASLLKRWNFPQPLIDAVAQHQTGPESTEDPFLNKAVYAASLLAQVLWVPESRHMATLQSILQDDFGLDTDGLISLAVDCKNQFHDCAAMFRVDVSAEEIDAAALRREAERQFHLAAIDASLELDTLESIVEDRVE
jgi:hypothetical protein